MTPSRSPGRRAPAGTAGQRAGLSRDAVVGAARALIVEESLESLSLRRVGAALGVTAPALYAHVDGKRDLLRAIAERELGALIERFEAVDDGDPVDRIRSYSRAYIDYAIDNPELFKTMFLFPPELPVAAHTGEELPIATRAFELPTAAIAEAVAAGTFPHTDPATAGLVLWVATHGAATVLLLGFDLDPAARDQLVTNVLDTVIAGLRNA